MCLTYKDKFLFRLRWSIQDLYSCMLATMEHMPRIALEICRFYLFVLMFVELRNWSVIPDYSYTAVGVFVLDRMFHEAWGKEAPQMQAEFNDYLQVFNAHGSSRTTRLFTSVFSFCVCLFS
jgi:hypothetical protein